MNIMDLFRSTPAVAAPAVPAGPTGAANPGQPLPGTQATQQTANNGVVPTQPEVKEKIEEPTPFAGFQEVWQTDPNAANDPNAPIFANLDPTKVMESAKKVDFTKALTPEILAKIQAGGQEAATTFAQAMNLVAQSGYAQSAIATTKIVEQALKKQREQFNSELPTLVKKFSVNENVQANNPIFKNAAIQPLVGALQEQLIRKNPNASAAEIQTQVGDFFQELGKTFAPTSPADKAAKTKAGSEPDWSLFLP